MDLFKRKSIEQLKKERDVEVAKARIAARKRANELERKKIKQSIARIKTVRRGGRVLTREEKIKRASERKRKFANFRKSARKTLTGIQKFADSRATPRTRKKRKRDPFDFGF